MGSDPGVADEVPRHGPDAHQGDQVAEGHRGAERVDRDDVAEAAQHVAVPGEAPAGAEVGGQQCLGLGGVGPHQGLGVDGHRTVDEHHGGVEPEADGEDPHPLELAVRGRPPGEGDERDAQQRAGRRHPDGGGEQVGGGATDGDRGHHQPRAGEVPAVRRPGETDRGADGDRSQDGQHRDDATEPLARRR